MKIKRRCKRFPSWPWEWAPSPRKICCCVLLPLSVHLLYWSPETRRRPWPTWGGVSSFEGWMAVSKVLPAECPPIITRYQGQLQICWMIWGKTKGGSSIPLTSRTTCMWPCACTAGWRVSHGMQESLQVPMAMCDTPNIMKHRVAFVLAACGGCKALCWCRSNAEAAPLLSSMLSNRRKRLPPYLPQWFESFFHFAESHVIGIKHKHWQTAECWSINNSCKRNG